MDAEYEISTDPARLDLDLIHGFLTTSYWAKGRRRTVVERRPVTTRRVVEEPVAERVVEERTVAEPPATRRVVE